ncbi:MAG TPA: nucleotide exchange factor GrpE [Candidatus Saccharimonadales bacterium]|nr:nucleotide exchange factor GrpE [Candidatus Saccharimonadales bacterium]
MTKAKKPTIKDLTEALQRERADADNIRRRHAEQMASLKDMVKANVIHELLPVIDNFDRALKHVPNELANNDYVKGVQGVVKQFEKTLVDMGVERIKTVGEVFDPQLHEAIHMEDGDPSTGSGQVVEIVSEELQPGYKLGDEIIRHAMVKVKMEKSNG